MLGYAFEHITSLVSYRFYDMYDQSWRSNLVIYTLIRMLCVNTYLSMFDTCVLCLLARLLGESDQFITRSDLIITSD